MSDEEKKELYKMFKEQRDKRQKNQFANEVSLNVLYALFGRQNQILLVKEISRISNLLADISLFPFITDKQFEELTNMIQQFNTILNDYLKENNIKMDMEE